MARSVPFVAESNIETTWVVDQRESTQNRIQWLQLISKIFSHFIEVVWQPRNRKTAKQKKKERGRKFRELEFLPESHPSSH